MPATIETPPQETTFPAERVLEEVYEDTLAWLQEHNPGLTEIPRGRRRIPWACPLARGLNSGGREFTVGGNIYYERAAGRANQKMLPKAPRRFRAYFDAGRYPHLIEDD